MAFKQAGRSIIFCSHSMYHVNLLCDEVIWLDHGLVRMQGTPQQVIPAYEHFQMQKDGNGTDEIYTPAVDARRPAVIESVELISPLPLESGCDLAFRVIVAAATEQTSYHVSLSLKIESGWGIHVTGTHLDGRQALQGQRREVIVRFPNIPLAGGFFFAHARVFDEHGVTVFHERATESFEIAKGEMQFGVCRFPSEWEIK